MASVCGTSLSLMDAGVPLAAPVAGVAMGLVLEGGRFKVLTDILVTRITWAHGFQGGRHQGWRHRLADGYQVEGVDAGDHAVAPISARWTVCTSWVK